MDILKNRLMALASSAEIQDALYPDFVAKGDELVLDFDDVFQKTDLSALSSQQREAFDALDSYLEINAGEEFEDMYCETSSLYNDQRWDEIRTLSKNILKSMGWSYQTPTVNETVLYVNADTNTGTSK